MGVFISLPFELRHWWRTRHLSRKLYLLWLLSQKTSSGDFSGGPVVKNPPDMAGDTSSIPGPGRSHIPRDCWARLPYGPCSAARGAPTARNPAPQLESSSRPLRSRKPARRATTGTAPNKPAQSLLTSRRDCPRGSTSWPQVPLTPPLLLSDSFTQQPRGQKPPRLKPLHSLPYFKILFSFFFLKWILFSLIFYFPCISKKIFLGYSCVGHLYVNIYIFVYIQMGISFPFFACHFSSFHGYL